MSGVLGIIEFKQGNHLDQRIGKMGEQMCYRPWYVFEKFVSDTSPVALGRIGIDIFNKDPQPVWNTSHTIALVMAGEIYSSKKDGFQKGSTA